MTNYHPNVAHIHIVARCFLTHRDSTILCRAKGASWYFLPGGHVENGESSKTALIRELHEEIGENEYSAPEFIGISENIFNYDENTLQQGVDVVYKVEISGNMNIVENKEDHIEFVVVKTSELENYTILPEGIKDGIIEYAKNGTLIVKGF